MAREDYLFTSESVAEGHPDKVCDQMSDAILDAMLKQDPQTRSGVECFGSHGALMIGGEVKTRAKVNFEKIAHQVYKDIGYTDKLKVSVEVAQQSPDIAMGVDTGGAGDQGIMYGYATRIGRRDRWAIVAYIRALQLSQHARLEDLPEAERNKLTHE